MQNVGKSLYALELSVPPGGARKGLCFIYNNEEFDAEMGLEEWEKEQSEMHSLSTTQVTTRSCHSTDSPWGLSSPNPPSCKATLS